MGEKYGSTEVEGYDRLAQVMGEAPEMAIFRRFGALSAEVLLHHQADLVGLETQLREQQKRDKESSPASVRRDYAVNFQKLQSSADSDAGDDHDDTQWELMQEIDEKLQRYHKALLRHNMVLGLRTPFQQQVESLNEWMQRPSLGKIYLTGPDRTIWSDPNLEDLVALEPESSDSSITSELTLKLLRVYNSIIGRRIHKRETKDVLRNTIRYRNEGTFRVLKILTTFSVCLITVAGISGLYSINYMAGRLGAMAIFTTIFSLALILITNAGMRDIFTTTAAFAAVLVVFVGANSGNCPPGASTLDVLETRG